MMKLFLILALVAGCASRGKQTEAFLKKERAIPDHQRIEEVPFVKQTQDYCGPASLAMVLKHEGQHPKLQTLGEEMFTPGSNGTFQADLIGTARRHGMMAVPIYGLESLLTEIAQGHPVIVLQNLAFSWYPKWHYAVAHGYDLPRRELLLHSGQEKNKTMGLDRFERNWELARYWGVVVFPPGELSATGTELDHTKSAAVLEEMGQLDQALEAYQSILKKWPESLSALIGVGNVQYTMKNYPQSVTALELAVKNHPDSALAWHNLAIAQMAAGLGEHARTSAKRALDLVQAPQDQVTYRDNLKECL